MFASLALDSRLLKSIEALKYTKPTAVQMAVIPKIHTGADLLVSAATGTGKTAAYLLPSIERMLADKGPIEGTRTLILAPTRELAQQIVKHCEKLIRFTHIKVGLITGGADFKYQKAMLRKDPEIIVATPGRLLEHIEKRTPQFDFLESLIIDEADRMLDMGFQDDVLSICEACRSECQKLMFSATLDNRAVNHVARVLLNNAEKISIGSSRGLSGTVTQQVILADNEGHKEKILLWLLENQAHRKALIFTNTRKEASRIRGVLRGQKHKVNVLHGEIKQDERNETMSLFRRGIVSLLVATDVASRGLDVNDVDLVINYDMVNDADDYVHRVGRTGRAGAAGLAISFITSNDWNAMVRVERYLDIQLERRKIKSLSGHFKGPKKLTSDGKAFSKKKKIKKSAKDVKKQKASLGASTNKKSRSGKTKNLIDGFAPFKKK